MAASWSCSAWRSCISRPRWRRSAYPLAGPGGRRRAPVNGCAGAGIGARDLVRTAANDTQKTYGFYRTEIQAALANDVLLIAVSPYILFEAWQRLGQLPDVDALPMPVVACGALLVTLLGLNLLHPFAEESLNVSAESQCTGRLAGNA